jgi:hypothetical protein
MTSIIPLQKPHRRNSELTNMKVNARLWPSLPIKRLFLLDFIEFQIVAVRAAARFAV